MLCVQADSLPVTAHVHTHLTMYIWHACATGFVARRDLLSTCVHPNMWLCQ
jgi:hypothetical protein